MRGICQNHDPCSAKALFDALSNGGKVTVPFKEQFWGDHYGNFTDKFGAQWAMNSRSRT